MAPLSAALANGDDTLSITADCYSTAGTDAAITAALLAYYTSAQVDALLEDHRTGTAQDAETTSAITAALLAYYTSAQVDALLGDYRTASAQDTQTQAAIAGALLAYRTGPDQDVFTTNQITSAQVAYRSAADQDTATASSIAAALLSYYTIAQVDGLLAGKLGHAGRAHRAGQRGLRPAAAQRRKLHGRVHDTRGRLGRRFLRSAHATVAGATVSSTGAVSSLSITGAASVGLLSLATINNTANAGNHGGRRVHGHADGIRRSNRGELRCHWCAYGRHAGASAGPLHCESLDCTFRPRAEECRRAAWSAAT